MTDRILTVTCRPHRSGTTVLTVVGEIDHHTAPRLSRVLNEVPFDSGKPLVVDMADVTYCDSTGVTVLVTAYRRAQAAGTDVTLAAVRPELMHTFRTIGLEEIFLFQPTTEHALDSQPS